MINIIRTAIILPVLLLSPAFSILPLMGHATGSAQKDLTVSDYSWKSYGTGRLASLDEITVVNSGAKSYDNIRIRVDLFARSGRFLGSLHGTIKGEVSAGSEKTFTDIGLGLMNSELEKSEVFVVDASTSDKQSDENASNSIFIKNWEFEGANFATEGFIPEITLENTGKIHFKNIKLLITETGSSRDGSDTHMSLVTIHDVLAAGEEKTFTGINVGYSNPEALERSIAVSEAQPISTKELNYILAGGGSIGQRIKEKISSIPILRKKNQEDGKSAVSSTSAKTRTSDLPQPQATLFNKDSSDTDKIDVSQTNREEGLPRQYTPTSPEDLREPFPQSDIVIRKFEWGSGIPGSVATLRTLIIENISNIPYEKIVLEIEFFKYGNTPFGSNRFKIKKTLAPNQTISLKNVQVGFINKLPDPNLLKLRVVKAEAVL